MSTVRLLRSRTQFLDSTYPILMPCITRAGASLRSLLEFLNAAETILMPRVSSIVTLLNWRYLRHLRRRHESRGSGWNIMGSSGGSRRRCHVAAGLIRWSVSVQGSNVRCSPTRRSSSRRSGCHTWSVHCWQIWRFRTARSCPIKHCCPVERFGSSRRSSSTRGVLRSTLREILLLDPQPGLKT